MTNEEGLKYVMSVRLLPPNFRKYFWLQMIMNKSLSLIHVPMDQSGQFFF